jgi:predicted Rossmann fold flavoprotein
VIDLLNYDVVVIGGGPAGMMAAGKAAANSRSVLLIEKNSKLGMKLYLTGKGRCNITNNTSVEQVIDNIIVNGKFLRNVLYKFTPEDVINFFEENGLKTKIERGNRIFPVSDKSSDVIKILQRYLTKNKVEVKTGTVTDLVRSGERFTISVGQEQLTADKVVIATGGLSYSSTGSTGDGYLLAERFGHTIIQQKPSLVPMNISTLSNAKIGRLNLRNISIKIISDKDVIYTDFGEMEIMDSIVSGPVILSASSYLRSVKNCMLTIDLKPALSEKKLDARLIREFEKGSGSNIGAILNRLIPIKLKEIILEKSQIDPNNNCGTINKQKRKRLLFNLKNLSLKIDGFRPFKEAIITSGGVSVKEIDPGTMESKLAEGLFFAGEVIDADALTGGFNLQIAWSTGYSAGINC